MQRRGGEEGKGGKVKGCKGPADLKFMQRKRMKRCLSVKLRTEFS